VCDLQGELRFNEDCAYSIMEVSDDGFSSIDHVRT